MNRELRADAGHRLRTEMRLGLHPIGREPRRCPPHQNQTQEIHLHRIQRQTVIHPFICFMIYFVNQLHVPIGQLFFHSLVDDMT